MKKITTILLMFLLFIGASANAQDWQTSTVFSGNSIYLSSALDSQDNMHIAFLDFIAYGNRPLKHAKWNGTSWAITTVSNHIGDVGGYISIAIDANDNPHISFKDHNSLAYASWNGSSWQIETIDSGFEEASGLYSSLAIDSEGNAHISYISTWTLEPYDLRYAYQDGTDWQIETLASFETAWTYDVNNSMALDANNYPHIAYNNGYDGVDMMYAYWDGSVWQHETVDTDGETGVNPSLRFDNNQMPHIAFFNRTTGELRYASRDNGSWEVSNIAYMGYLETISAVSLDFDSYNSPHIAYNHQDGMLHYATLDNETWNTQIACDIDYSGYFTSLAIDENDNRHIAHYEWYFGTLLYTFSENPVLTVDAKFDDKSITTFPNPANNFVNIQSKTEILEISVFNNMGQLVYFANVSSANYQLETAKWESGIYIVKIKTETKFLQRLINIL